MILNSLTQPHKPRFAAKTNLIQNLTETAVVCIFSGRIPYLHKSHIVFFREHEEQQ